MTDPHPLDRAHPRMITTGAAWGVHLMTASGAIIALLALFAAETGDFRQAFLWLLIGLAVDGVDGTLARKLEVDWRAPRIDGPTLDLVVDYLTFVFVPTLLIWRAGLVPAEMAFGLGAMILVSSLYVFARRDMKTEDNYFRGFPALWNIVAYYLYMTATEPRVGAIVVVVFVALTFAPIHFVHPFRVRRHGRWLPALAILWGLATLALIWPDWTPGAWQALLYVSLGSGLILILLGLWRSISGPKMVPPPGV